MASELIDLMDFSHSPPQSPITSQSSTSFPAARSLGEGGWPALKPDRWSTASWTQVNNSTPTNDDDHKAKVDDDDDGKAKDGGKVTEKEVAFPPPPPPPFSWLISFFFFFFFLGGGGFSGIIYLMRCDAGSESANANASKLSPSLVDPIPKILSGRFLRLSLSAEIT